MRQSPIILHDAFRFPGGGEKVAQCLAELTGGILWTAEYNHAAFPPDFFGERHPLDLRARQAHPDLARWSETACLWKAFASFPPSNPPYTLYSGMLAPLAWKRLGGKRILYCHTPPRILYDQRRFYLRSMPRTKRWAYELFLRAFERAWAKAARAMDLIVSNSQNVAHRLGGYLQLDSVVVHPPVRTADFRWVGQGDYYLSTARVDRLKRVDTVVEAFLGMPEKRLVVVSGGSELERVRAMAAGAPNIEVKGWVTPEELRALTGACIATVYIPRDEDFGISPVESMAAGKPVIGVAEGGLLETVKENRTGILVRSGPTASDVALAVRAMTPQAALAMRPACEERARKFDEAAFKAAMARHIESVTGRR